MALRSTPSSYPYLQRRGGSVAGRRLLWERGVRLWRDPQKGFCARETWQMSLNTFLNHHFKPQLSQLQDGAGSPSLWLLESISTKVRVQALSWMKGRAWLSERGLQGRGSHYSLTRPPLTGRFPAEAWQNRVPDPAARAGRLQPGGGGGGGRHAPPGLRFAVTKPLQRTPLRNCRCAWGSQ